MVLTYEPRDAIMIVSGGCYDPALNQDDPLSLHSRSFKRSLRQYLLTYLHYLQYEEYSRALSNLGHLPWQIDHTLWIHDPTYVVAQPPQRHCRFLLNTVGWYIQLG